MNRDQLTLGSLFDGIGGFPYAASFYGIRTLWASEIVPECVSVTKRHFPDMEHVGDITQLSGWTLPPVDIITFGSPCQDLSVASGKRLGLAGAQSGLFLEAIRIIREMKEATDGEYPKFAIWENVPGALSSSARCDFKAVLEAFAETAIPMPGSGKWANAGMVRGHGVDLAWCVYDAQYFGTAQRRRRIFLVADFRGKCAGEILFVPKSLSGYFAAGGTPRQGLAAYAPGSSGAADEPLIPAVAMRMRSGCEGGGKGPLFQVEKSGTLATHNDQTLFKPEMKIEILNDQGGASMTVEQGGVAPTLRCQAHGNLPITAYAIQGSIIGRKDENGSCGDGINENVSFTLNTIDRHAICMATGQANAEIMAECSPTLVAGHEQPIVTLPQVAGTLCASGAGLSRPAGQGNELDFCVVSAGVQHNAIAKTGSVGFQEEQSPTLMSGQTSGVMTTHQAAGQDAASAIYCVRRLTPTEAERLQGYPDGWTKYGASGEKISDTKRYQMLGNSIAVPCVAYIMQGICAAMEGG